MGCVMTGPAQGHQGALPGLRPRHQLIHMVDI